MTIPTLNPATGEYELPDHSGGLFGLTDPGMMNYIDPAYVLWYNTLADIAYMWIPILIAAVMVLCIVLLPYFIIRIIRG